MNSKENLASIYKCRKYTEKKLADLEKALRRVDSLGANIVVNGSYARGEASSESDFDYLVIFPGRLSKSNKDAATRRIAATVKRIIGKLPSKGGVFESPITVGDLTKDIGGQDDTNKDITHRILFLTEGRPLGDRSLFEQQKEQLIERYIQNTIKDHNLALFFLNDVIRYWRTICVDFENKTFEKGKDWGTRNIKLVFSRRLLYFGGVIIAAETAQQSWQEKRRIFSELATLTPIDRLVQVCGGASDRALRDYDHFLEKMMQAKTRSMLKLVSKENDQNEEFRSLKNRGHHFALHLISVLQTTYPSSHPIHKSLIM